jgi:hypothetical protein
MHYHNEINDFLDALLCFRKQMPEYEEKHPTWPVKKKFGTQPSAGEVMLTLYLGCTRVHF